MATAPSDDQGRSGASRYDVLDAVRGLGILAVVVDHFSTSCNRWLHTFHLPVFFVVGGLLYEGARGDFRTFVARKVRSLLVPYYAVGAALLAYWWLLERHFRTADGGLPWYLALLGLITGSDGTGGWLRFGGTIWFLPTYFALVVLFDALSRLAQGRWRLPGVLLLVLAGGALAPRVVLPFGLVQALGALGWFWLGHQLRATPFLSIATGRGTAGGLLAATAALALSVATVDSVNLSTQNLGTSVFSLYGESLPGVLLLVALGGLLASAMPLRILGESSLYVMCFHPQIGRVVTKVASVVSGIPMDDLRRGGASLLLSLAIAALTTVLVRAVQRGSTTLLERRAARRRKQEA